MSGHGSSSMCDHLFCPKSELSVSTNAFNSYGSRRGNDDVMSRGTFANVRLVNKFMNSPGSKTLHIPSGEEVRS